MSIEMQSTSDKSNMEATFKAPLSKPWVLKDDRITIGKVSKKTFLLSDIKKVYVNFNGGEDEGPDLRVINVSLNDGSYSTLSTMCTLTEFKEVARYIVKNAPIDDLSKRIELAQIDDYPENQERYSGGASFGSPMEAYNAFMATTGVPKTKPSSDKPASVVGRAAAGAVIAGPAGAVVGALSAVDKNNRSKK